MKYLKICYLAILMTAFGCETAPLVEPTQKAQQQLASLITTEETAPFSYAGKTYTLPGQPFALPYSTNEKPLTATKFFIADATVVIDAATGAIDLAATMAQQPIPAGTSREATVQFLDNGVPGSLRVTIYRYRTVDEIPAELIKQISGAGGRMETNPPKQRNVSPPIIIISD